MQKEDEKMKDHARQHISKAQEELLRPQQRDTCMTLSASISYLCSPEEKRVYLPASFQRPLSENPGRELTSQSSRRLGALQARWLSLDALEDIRIRLQQYRLFFKVSQTDKISSTFLQSFPNGQER
ncbi:hypothetical protein C0Q70_19029 [Pomacea canaliculata]|uniref:Uncharacterized protein n=1 Tax=Pomacea canaliculata TaxID=400727 RepID=A0A2T7NI61_POMCA|nr:hypothetical protein C0Q70_19029 [Pomacea canaliculata]